MPRGRVGGLTFNSQYKLYFVICGLNIFLVSHLEYSETEYNFEVLISYLEAMYTERKTNLFLFSEMMTVLDCHVEMLVVQAEVFELPLVQVELVQATLLHPADISCGGVHELQTLVEKILSKDA